MVTYLTNNGTALMNSVIGAESVLNFTKIQFGNGTSWSTEASADLRQEIAAATALQNVIKEVEFDDQNGNEVIVDPETGLALLKASFSNIGDDYDWHATEIGLWAQDGEDTSTEILYAVSAVDVSKAAWVPTQDESAATFEFSVYVYVGDVADVTAVLSVDADKASKQDLDDHIQNKSNPHETTKAQVGLGNVPNVETNDQRPYFTIAAADAGNIDGGTQTNQETGETEGKETLSVILGKVKRFIDSFIIHKADYTNPHKVTAAQVNAAPVKHYHSANDINRDVLPIERGGTGTNKGFNFTGSSYNCWGYSYLMGDNDKGKILIQWGRVKVEDRDVYVSFDKAFANANYVLTFDTSGNDFVPVWKKPTKAAGGFTMNRTFGVSSAFNNWLQSLFGIRLFGGSVQVADWIAIGRAAD